MVYTILITYNKFIILITWYSFFNHKEKHSKYPPQIHVNHYINRHKHNLYISTLKNLYSITSLKIKYMLSILSINRSIPQEYA
jgi:hypothetical protein